MIDIEGKIVSSEVFSRQFVCDLNACKGACCVAGDSGAPLRREELEQLDMDLDAIKPFLNQNGIAAIEKQGVGVIDQEGELTTPLVESQACAYAVFTSDGTARCGIEDAWKAGATPLQKPVSCHLYPIRITEYKSFDAVNYNEWKICDPACSLGDALKVPVYKFLKEALIRKYGFEWFAQLEIAASYLEDRSQEP
jgi:hypothetical protein